MSLLLLAALLSVASPGAASSRPPAGAAAALATHAAMPDSTQDHYAQKDVRALQRMLEQAETRAQRLLCRYRLYPLTEDERYLEDLPEDLPEAEAGASARELALLSGLWGYRAAQASFFGAMRAGRRSMRLLERAREKDADDPFVLLIGGQSLLFRPAIAGGDDEEALDHFRRLRQILDGQPDTPVSATEAALWNWYALRETDRTDEAQTLHRELASSDLPPLYREFLRHPPG